MRSARIFLVLLLMAAAVTVKAEPPSYAVLVNIHDKASLQRGAKLYLNYCSGCHSLKFMHYQQLAQGIGIVDSSDRVLTQIVKENLIFDNAKLSDVIQTALPTDSAKQWFGKVPPDLSVIVRAKGAAWVYTYLRSFYRDANQVWGVNNLLIPNVAMPNVLSPLQGVQIPVYNNIKAAPTDMAAIDHLVLIEKGRLSAAQFNSSLTDLVNFLAYVSEPAAQEREKIGLWVILYLVIMTILLFCLYKTYRK